MKKLTCIISFLLTLNVFKAQTNTATQDNSLQAPSTLTTRFNSDYPGMQPRWSVDGDNYRAEYWNGGLGHRVTYDPNGKLLSTEEQLSMGNYPSSIGDYYTKNYPGEPYEVWYITTASGDKTYYTNRNSETIWFDKSGKYKNTSKTKAGKK